MVASRFFVDWMTARLGYVKIFWWGALTANPALRI